MLVRRGWDIASAVDAGMLSEVVAQRGSSTLHARSERRSKAVVYTFSCSFADPAIAGTAKVHRRGMLRSIWWDAPRDVFPLVVVLAPVFLLLLAPFWLVRLAIGRRGLPGPWPRDFKVEAPYPDAAKPAMTPALVQAIVGSRYLGSVELLPGNAHLVPYLGTSRRGVERTLAAFDEVERAVKATPPASSSSS